MKKFVVAALGLFCAASVAVHAEDTKDAKKKTHMTDEQKTLWKEIVAKYDANKDGKLDKDERAKMSQEDKDKLEKAGLNKSHKKDKSDDDKKSASK